MCSFLIGNKIDLSKERQISREEAELFANKEKIEYVETSAIKNIKVNEVFTSLLNHIYKRKKEEKENQLLMENGGNIGLQKNQNKCKNNDSNCC